MGGTTVKRASLHNADQIEKLDIRVNDTVFVEKGGEIIPKIVGVEIAQRDIFSVPTEYITTCPECETALVRKEGDAKHFCPNEWGCPPQIKGKMQHFISRKALNIDGLGEGGIELLFENKVIKNYSDLYILSYDKIFGLEKWNRNDESGIKFENQLQVKLEKAIYGLGWGNITLEESKTISKNLDEIGDVMNLGFSFNNEVKDKKLIKFQEALLFNIKRVNVDSKDRKGFISFDYLLKLKYPEIEEALYEKVEFLDFIDELLNVEAFNNLPQPQFENFIIRISDRSRISFQELTANNLLVGIEISKQIPFERVLYGIGIRFVGETVAKKLARQFKNIDNKNTQSPQDETPISSSKHTKNKFHICLLLY